MDTGHRRWLLAGLTGLLAVSAGASMADDRSPLAVGAKVGTLGLGAELTCRLAEPLNFRATGNWLRFSYDNTISEIEYELEPDFQSFGFLLDWHPFRNHFRLTAGAVQSDNQITLEGTPSDPERIGDVVYTPEQIGTLTGTVDFDGLVPYLGIGFGNAVRADQSWSFSFDLGVILQPYDVTLTADGLASQLPGFQRNLLIEEQSIEDDLNQFELYPVLAFGIAYHF